MFFLPKYLARAPVTFDQNTISEIKNTKTLKIISSNSTSIFFNIDVADTPQKRAQGLSGKTSLDAQSGLLFILNAPEYAGIWMKDMLFPIDIIWIGENMKIVGIEKNATPESFPKIFTPTEKSLYVLEINAGSAQKNNIKVDDTVVI